MKFRRPHFLRLSSYSFLRTSYFSSTWQWFWRHRLLTAVVLAAVLFGVQFVLLKYIPVEASYNIANSARFIAGSSDGLTRTPSSTSGNDSFTFSTWVKRGTLGSNAPLLGADPAGINNHELLRFNTSDQLVLVANNATVFTTTAVFRDPAAWLHVVFVKNGTTCTVYVNNVSVGSGTCDASFIGVNVSGVVQEIGRFSNDSYYFDGYMADTYMVSGSALTPASFAATDLNGYWRPALYTGTYGTNGFKLAFTSGHALGTDTGSSNNFATSSAMTQPLNQMYDTPTNGFATGNPLALGGAPTYSAGNLTSSGAATSTVLMTSGKWYWEVKANAASVVAGVMSNTGTPNTTSVADGTTSGFFFDADAGTLSVTTNGTSYTSVAAGLTGGRFAYATGASNTFNYGQGGQSSLTYYSSAGGYFKYNPDGATPAEVETFLTSGTSYTVPSDWNSSSNTIEVIGGGAGGSSSAGSGGGGGGGYSKVTNVTLSGSVTYAIGSGGGLDTSGGDTYFCNSTSNCASIAGSAVQVGAKGGVTNSGTTGGAGGALGSGVGTTKYSGGNGGAGIVGVGGGGGGGGAGLNGAGNNGNDAFGGNSGGSGGSGDAGSGGSGGVGNSSDGGNGTEWDATHGSGGGGGGGGNSGNPNCTASNGGYYGAGGGSSGCAPYAGGVGRAGLIVVTYTPSGSLSGYKALSTYNLPEPAIDVPKNYFDIATYAGNGAARSIVYSTSTTAINFAPSLVWIKDRTSALAHQLFDSSRSAIPYWSSNSTAAEVSPITALTAFLANGFTIGTNSNFNTTGNNYVSWAWDESTTSGVDVVTYTGDNTSDRAVSHSLAKRPDFVIVKRREAAGDSYVWHNKFKDATTFALLDSTAATSTTNSPWGTGGFTASTFMVTNNGTNNLNASGANYVAYLFASTTGFSDFGSYTGNGSADGPFVYTGFKPKYVMLKRTNGTGSWLAWDTARDTYNAAFHAAFPDLNSAESTSGAWAFDFLSNGFKLRNLEGENNASGGQYVHAAFAEQPFQQSAQAYNLTIASSTRFITGNSTFLTRTQGSAGETKKYTYSIWFKGTASGWLFSAGPTPGTNGATDFYFTSEKLEVFDFDGGTAMQVRTAAVFRDPATWHHLVASIDTTQAIETERVKMYVNGVRMTSFSVATYPAQNTELFPSSNVVHRVGQYIGNGQGGFPDGYLSDAYFVDGAQLPPTCFAEYDTNGYWRPKTYSTTLCAAYGTNGFHLPLTTTSPGDDTGTNNSDWTANNFAATDNVKDSPTNNFATWSSIDKTSSGVVSKGNLTFQGDGAAWQYGRGTIGVSSGKWCVESAQVTASTGSAEGSVWMQVGFFRPDKPMPTAGTLPTDSSVYGNGLIFSDSGWRYNFATGASVTTAGADGDGIQVCVDLDAGTYDIRKNGSSVDSGTLAYRGELVPFASSFGTARYYNYNFGQGGLSGLTYYSTPGGYFKYEPPSGYKALSTGNLSAPTITRPDQYFDARTYTGTSTAQTIGSSTPSTNTQIRIFLTSTTAHQWNVPSDWNSASNTVEVIGGGGGGATAQQGGFDASGSGGGGGAYSKTYNVSLTPGGSVTVAVGAGGGVSTAGGDTYLCTTVANCASITGTAVTVGAKGGGGAGTGNPGIGTPGSGGAASGGTGAVKYSGGNGGATVAVTSNSGGGGGGAGGSSGAGANGATGSCCGSSAGAGGGGSDGGTGGSSGSGTTGGAGGAGGPASQSAAGAGATSGNNAVTPTATAGYGGAGAGGAGLGATNGAAGGAGKNWDETHGAGGGGSSAGTDTGTEGTAGGGGLYGGGGSGGTYFNGLGGAGAQGIIVITYTPNPLQFQPDIVWIKDRTTTNAHGIFDSYRTTYTALAANDTSLQGGNGTALTSFLTNGFTLGASTTVNTSGNSYVSWMWKESTTAGFDIVTYTGDGTTNRDISHSLGKSPDFIITKARDDATYNWHVWHTGIGADYYLALNSTAAKDNSVNLFPYAGITSSSFRLTSSATAFNNLNGKSYIAYLFASTTGFSAFGSYTGNGAADGPFVYTGFKPRFVMVRDATIGGDWFMWDAARSPYNPVDKILQANQNAADVTSTNVDLLSNGFKLRIAGGSANTASSIVVYAAFAETPYKYSALQAEPATFVQAVAFLLGMTY